MTKPVIRHHYDLTTPFYWLLWGRHLHHGLFESGSGPRAAQQTLTDRLIQEASLPAGSRVLDVGCGMGGSSIFLAQSLDCRTTGITVSPVQRRWARWSARWHGVTERTDFRVQDAETAEFSAGSFDALWSIECTEHLFDKPAFFRRAATWIRPGGRVAICAWLAGDALPGSPEIQQVRDVCEGFFCPSLGTMEDYQQWMSAAGFEVEKSLDWTEAVLPTWEICQQRVRRAGGRYVARLLGRDMKLFVDSFAAIRQAYESGAMRYGCFVASRHQAAVAAL